MEEAFARYLQSSEFMTLKDKRNILLNVSMWAPHLAGRHLDEAPQIAELAVKDWLVSGAKNASKGLAHATINRRLALLRRVLNIAYKRWEWLEEPIAQKIQLLHEDNERHIYLTRAESVQLRRACKDRAARAVITLLLCTGARYGEIARAKREDVRDGVLYLHARTKRGKPRAVPILTPGMRYVDDLPITATYRAVRYHFDLAKQAIGRTDIHMHDLRHTTASWIVQSGGTLKDAQDWLGHTNPVTTQRYAHLHIERARDVAQKVHTSLGMKTRKPMPAKA